MTLDQPRPHPYHWWGDAWSTRNPQSLESLIASGHIDNQTAERLRTHVFHGGSVVVCASESGAGKSTLAHAMIECLPSDRIRIYLRGTHEMYGWLDSIDPGACTLLINEISPHLPVYLWGSHLHTALALGRAGAQIIATAHASTVDEVIEMLAAANCNQPTLDVEILGLVVVINDQARILCG